MEGGVVSVCVRCACYKQSIEFSLAIPWPCDHAVLASFQSAEFSSLSALIISVNIVTSALMGIAVATNSH